MGYTIKMKTHLENMQFDEAITVKQLIDILLLEFESDDEVVGWLDFHREETAEERAERIALERASIEGRIAWLREEADHLEKELND
jgi:hypothetical protein